MPSHAGLFRAVLSHSESCPAPQPPEGAVPCLQHCLFPLEHPQLGEASQQEREGEVAKEEEFQTNTRPTFLTGIHQQVVQNLEGRGCAGIIIPRFAWKATARAGWGNAERHKLQGDVSPLPWGITNISQGKEQLSHRGG